MSQKLNDLDLRNSILKELMFKKNSSFSELEKITDNHDLFTYHLRELQTKGFVVKKDKCYELTQIGRQSVAFMEEDGKYQKQIKVSMFIDLIRVVNGKYQMLLYKRLKHPHYGFIGAVTGKLKWGDTLEENLKRELDEELGIVPLEYTNIGVAREIFRDELGEKVGDGVFFIFVVTKWRGVPAESSIEGEYFWCDIDEILNLDKIFRSGFENGLPKIKEFLKSRESFSPYIIENGTDKLEF
jgi:ADP-ribose pyrophosphatase YjhB (NUDIX family)